MTDHWQCPFCEANKSDNRRTGCGEWRTIEDWHEDIGPCFWTCFPVQEPYYAGCPLSDDWPSYHTHFIPMEVLDHLLDKNGMPLPAPPVKQPPE